MIIAVYMTITITAVIAIIIAMTITTAMTITAKFVRLLGTIVAAAVASKQMTLPFLGS